MFDKKMDQAVEGGEAGTLPWYQVKFTWLVFALPLSAVIAGLTTAWIAFNGADALVKDNYYKDGLAINRNLEKVQLAKKLGVSVTLNFDKGKQALVVSLDQGRAVPADSLSMYFIHPTLAERDFQLKARVNISQTTFYLPLPLNLSGNWQVNIVPSHEQWQLQSQWNTIQENNQLVL